MIGAGAKAAPGQDRPTGLRRLRGSVAVAPLLLALGVSVSGCSADRANPLNWFGDDAGKASADTRPLTSDEPYPNVGDVPGRPPRPPAVDRNRVAAGLVADRENAQYTEDTIRRSTEAPPPARPAPRPAQAAVPPAAPPPAPVASTPLPPAEPAAPAAAPPVEPPPPAPAYAPGPMPTPAAPAIASGYSTPAMPGQPAAPAEVPADRGQPGVQVVNNQPVVSPGYYATEPPPPPPPAAPVPPPLANRPPSLDPLQNVITGPPQPALSSGPTDAVPNPADIARAQNVPARAIEPAPLPVPAAPRDVAPIPSSASDVYAVPPGVAPVQGVPVRPSQSAAAAPPAIGPGGRSLDDDLRRAFPESGPQPAGGPGPMPAAPAYAPPPPAYAPSQPAYAPPPAPMMPTAPLAPGGGYQRGLGALVATIYFADGTAGLTEDDRSIIREVARLHRERGGAVRLIGHASSDGRGANPVQRQFANLDLAARRADAVSRELTRFGVPGAAVTASAEGVTAASSPASRQYGPAGDRRVDIYLDY